MSIRYGYQGPMEMQLGFIDIIQVWGGGLLHARNRMCCPVRDKTCLGFQQSNREKGEDFEFQQPDTGVRIMA
jgi:hypothetical protein